MSTLLLSPPAPSEVEPSRGAASVETRVARPWLLSPAADLLFILNIGWPLIVWLQVSAGMAVHKETLFWQVYFVTTPHRWITLVYVFLDRRRLQDRGPLLVGVLLAALAACGAATLATGTLACLLTVDYLWNAWHFAAQHHGVYRLYARSTDPASNVAVTMERYGLRGLLLYVSARVAGGVWAWPELEQTLLATDWIVGGLAGVLLLSALWRQRSTATTSVWYLASVTALYGGTLMAVHQGRPELVLAFATASALFHALEYLGVITWSMQRKTSAEHGWLSHLAVRAGATVLGFAVVLGAGAWLLDRCWTGGWLFLNVAAAFSHYALDGLIWRRGGAR